MQLKKTAWFKSGQNGPKKVIRLEESHFLEGAVPEGVLFLIVGQFEEVETS